MEINLPRRLLNALLIYKMRMPLIYSLQFKMDSWLYRTYIYRRSSFKSNSEVALQPKNCHYISVGVRTSSMKKRNATTLSVLALILFQITETSAGFLKNDHFVSLRASSE